MQPFAISDAVRRFVAEHLSSHETLAVLLLLHGRGPAPSTAAELAAHVGAPEPVVEGSLSELAAVGLVAAAPGGWMLQPRSVDLADVVTSLARLHEEHLPELIELMNSSVMGRLRESAAHHFQFTLPAGRRKA